MTHGLVLGGCGVLLPAPTVLACDCDGAGVWRGGGGVCVCGVSPPAEVWPARDTKLRWRWRRRVRLLLQQRKQGLRRHIGGESCGDANDIGGGETAQKSRARTAATGSAAAPAEARAVLVQYGSSSSSPAPALRKPPGCAKEGADLVQQGSSNSSPAPAPRTPPGCAKDCIG